MRALKSVTLDFADGAGPRVAQLSLTGDHVWSVNVPRPPLDDYKAHAAVAVVTDLSGNTATASLNVTVDVKPPALSITSPTAGAKLNIASFPTNNNVQLTWVLTDGDPSPTISLVQADGGLVTPPTLPTSPTDNPKPYTATLKATDRAGNTAMASVSFTVDRVAPTILSTTPVNDTRMFAGPTSANFSEPMITTVDGLNLNPFAGGGTWTTPQHYEVGGLLKDTVYNAITGAATDLHGNPLASSSFRFHTETFTPGSGAQLAFGYQLVFEATADIEGTINIIAKRLSNNASDWLQINPSSGAVAVLDSNAAPNQAGLLSAARTINGNLSSRRLAGLTVNPGPSGIVRYSIDGAAPISVAGTAQVFIPTRALPGEGTGLGEFGVIAGNSYQRTGRSNLALSLSQVGAFNFSDTRWQVVVGNMGGIDSQDFACSPVCNLSGVKSLGGGSVGSPNAAISLSCSVQGYQAAGFEKTTLFRYQPGCGGTANPCAPDLTEDNNFDQVVADPLHDGTFYGYNIDGNGNYQVKKRVLSSANCSGTITNVGAPINIPLMSNQGTPQLVVLRGVPGFITPNAGNNLIFVAP